MSTITTEATRRKGMAAHGPGEARAIGLSLAFPRSHHERPADLGLLIMRSIVGAVFIGHGGQKLFSWWGGGGIEGTGKGFEGAGLSPGEPLALLAGSGEFFGGILLILGLLTRLGAFSIAASMVVAIVAMHLPGPFLDGYEFPLTLLGVALFLLLAGPGRFSVDAAIRDRIAARRAVADGAPPTPRTGSAGAR